jgi:hypothetical protein
MGLISLSGSEFVGLKDLSGFAVPRIHSRLQWRNQTGLPNLDLLSLISQCPCLTMLIEVQIIYHHAFDYSTI